MARTRTIHLPPLADIRRELAAAFSSGPGTETARAYTLSALLVVFIPVLLLELLFVASAGIPVAGYLLPIVALGGALALAMRGYARLAAWIALLALLVTPVIGILTGQASMILSGIYFIQTTFAALVVGLILLQPRPYIAFGAAIFVGMLVIGWYVNAGTPVANLIVPFSATVMLELMSVILVVVIFRAAEVYARRQAQAELQLSKERYRHISELVGDISFSISVLPDGTLRREWTSGRGSFAGFTNLPLDGPLDPAEFIHPDDLPRLMAGLNIALQGQEAAEDVRMVSPTGEIRWARAIGRGVRDETTGLVTTVYAVLEDIHERRLAEDAVRTGRERYEALVHSIDGVVYEINAETRQTLFISKQVERLLGYPEQAFVENPMLWIERIHPEDVERVLAYTRQKQAGPGSYETQYRVLAKDGRVLWMRDIASVIIEPGQPVRLRGVALNDTMAREAEQTEQEQRRLHEALRGTIAAISTTLDLDEISDRILQSLHTTMPADAADIMFIEEGVAHVYRARDFAGSADIEQIMRAVLPIATTPNLQQMIATGRPYITGDITANPDWVQYFNAPWIRSMASAPIQLDQETIGFLNLTSAQTNVFTIDHGEYLQTFAGQVAIAVRNARLYDQVRRSAHVLAGEVKERTAELELERQRLSVMLDSTGDGIYYTEGRVIRYTNPAFCAMLGYSPNELIGQTTDMLMPEEKPGERAFEQAMYDILSRERVWRGERKIRRKDGTLMDGGLTISTTQSHNPGTARLVVLVRDISREKALAAQQSNLVAYASHELRTPITNLKTRLYLLRRRPELLDEHVEILEEVTDRMRRLVEDLLDLTRMERGVTRLQRRVTDVVALAQSIYRLQVPEADRKGLHFSVSLPDTPIYADLDPERITQVITNLITNALNYTPSGGTVRLSAALAPDNASVLVRVMDSGVGISAGHLPFIFQPFFRVASTVEGAGLGLSIAREIVELHNGTIEVKSQPDQGSTFTVLLPVLAAPALGVS